jgi:hypothetical protein
MKGYVVTVSAVAVVASSLALAPGGAAPGGPGAQSYIWAWPGRTASAQVAGPAAAADAGPAGVPAEDLRRELAKD